MAKNPGLEARIEVKHGKLYMQTLSFRLPRVPRKVKVMKAGQTVGADPNYEHGRLILTLGGRIRLEAGETMDIIIS
jgi:hypothetical protein